MDSRSSKRNDFHLTLSSELARHLHSTFGPLNEQLKSLSPEELTIQLSPAVAFELYKGLRMNIIPRRKPEDIHSSIPIPEPDNAVDNDEDDIYRKIAIVSNIYRMIEMEAIRNAHIIPQRVILDSKTRNQPQPHSHAHVQRSASVGNLIRRASGSGRTGGQLKLKQVNYLSLESDIPQPQGNRDGNVKRCNRKRKIMMSSASPELKVHFSAEAKLLTESVTGLSDETQMDKVVWFKTKIDEALDLHGLTMNEAEAELIAFLQKKETEFAKSDMPEMTLLIMTGKGRHSKNGFPILEPAVRDFLIDRQYDFCHHDGLFTVSLTRDWTGGHGENGLRVKIENENSPRLIDCRSPQC